MNDIYDSIDEIANKIKQRDCYEKLKNIESQMESNEEVVRLSLAFNKAQMEYSDGLKHYDEDSKEIKELFDQVRKTKSELDSNPLVLEYYKVFSEVNEPLNYIQFKLISLFTKKENYSCE